MFHFMILDLWDKDRFEDFDSAVLIDFQTFDNVSDATAKCDEMLDKYLKDYAECDDEDFNEDEYVESLYVDNEKTYRNFLFEAPTFSRQFMVIKGDK